MLFARSFQGIVACARPACCGTASHMAKAYAAPTLALPASRDCTWSSTPAAIREPPKAIEFKLHYLLKADTFERFCDLSDLKERLIIQHVHHDLYSHSICVIQNTSYCVCYVISL